MSMPAAIADRPLADATPRAIVAIVAAAFFMETLDASVIVTALPAIAHGFGGTVLGVSFAITAYLLAMAVFVPAAGWAADRFGARRVFAAAVALFTLASLACGLSPTLDTFVLARIVQGGAAAFMSPVGRLVVLRETPKSRIIEALGTVTWPGLIAPVLGPPLGGLIVAHTTWRWIFLLNVPLGIAGVWLILRFVTERTLPARTRFDRLGFVLTGLALAALIEGLTLLGEQHGAGVAATGLVVFGACCAVVSVWHARRADAPMLDLRAVGVHTFSIATLSVGFASRIAINASPFLLPLMFQVGFGMSALQAGAMVLVYMMGNLLMKSATTALLRRFGFRDVLVVNGVVCTLTLFACGLLAPGDPMVAIDAILFVAGMARSLNFTTITTLAFVDVHAEHRAGASTLATMLQQVSMTMGVALAAFVLALSQSLRGADHLALADFHRAWFAVGALMALAAAGSLRLARDAGAAATQAAR